MARYIDADALREPLTIIIKNAEAKELYNIAFNYEHCLKMIDDTPTADVVPRAEVIDELERYILLNENIALKCKRENGEQNEEYFKGKLAAFKQIRGFIDCELKKKYTEVQK